MIWSWEQDDISPEQWQEASRANGEAICSECGVDYYHHYQPAKATCPSLVIVCDGRWLKL